MFNIKSFVIFLKKDLDKNYIYFRHLFTQKKDLTYFHYIIFIVFAYKLY